MPQSYEVIISKKDGYDFDSRNGGKRSTTYGFSIVPPIKGTFDPGFIGQIARRHETGHTSAGLLNDDIVLHHTDADATYGTFGITKMAETQVLERAKRTFELALNPMGNVDVGVTTDATKSINGPSIPS